MTESAFPNRLKTLTGYKWTRSNGMSWHDEAFGPYEVGAVLTVPGAVKGDPCGAGLHFSSRIEDAIGYGRFPGALWRVESDGPVLGKDKTKMRVGSLCVIESVEKPAWVVWVEAFMAEIATVPWGVPQGPPLSSWKHYPTRDAAGAAARDAAWAAARAAAGDAAGAAAWDAAGAAAGAAELSAALAACSDLPIDQCHRDHAAARWEVWTMGYALACDVDGVLFTYDWPV